MDYSNLSNMANGNKNCTINQTNNNIQLTDEQFQEFLKLNQTEKSSLNDLQEEINNAYESAARIINNQDSFFIITEKNKEILEKDYDFLKKLEKCYTGKNDEKSLIYYRNLFVILSHIKENMIIDEYEKLDSCYQEDNQIKFFYAVAIMPNNIDKAIAILEKLSFENEFENSFVVLLQAYFRKEEWKKIVDTKKKINNIKDKSGMIAALYIISLSKLKSISEKELLKNNNKYKNMPLYYSASACIIKEKINKKSHKIKEQFKKALKCVEESDITTIDLLYHNSIYLNFEELMIEYLMDKESSVWLKIILTKLLINKQELSKIEIKKLEVLSKEFEEENIKELDNDAVKGIINLHSGHEIDATKNFKESYDKTKNQVSLYNYIQYSMKNFYEFDDKYLVELSECDKVEFSVLTVEAYIYKNNLSEAMKNAYNVIYLLDNKYIREDILKRFVGWNLLNEENNKKITKEEIVKDDVIQLENQKKHKIKNVVIESNEKYKEGNKILDVLILHTDNPLALELLGKKIKDTVTYNSDKYMIKNKKDKYTFFTQLCFSKIKTADNFKIFTGSDTQEVIEQIKEELKKSFESEEKIYDLYNNIESPNIGLPISFFKKPNMPNDYEETICNLFSKKGQNLFAGEINHDLNLKDGFVIDITSLIILNLHDMLDLLKNYDCKKIYITTSLKKCIKHQYNALLEKQGDTELRIGINCENQLFRSEINVTDRIDFWKKIILSINEFSEEEVEASISSDRVSEVLDKKQLDLMCLAEKLNLPFVCDDLLIRKLAVTEHKINTTNSMKILVEDVFFDEKDEEKNTDEFKFCEYMKKVKYLTELNYMYVVDQRVLGLIIANIFENETEENNLNFKYIIDNILSNKLSFDCHIFIIMNVINVLKNILYIKIGDTILKNIKIYNLLKIMISAIEEACTKLNISYEKYRVYFEDIDIEE